MKTCALHRNVCRRDSEAVLELLGRIADDSDFSTDSEEEEELELLYLHLAFSSTKDRGPRFSVELCSEADFELLFR